MVFKFLACSCLAGRRVVSFHGYTLGKLCFHPYMHPSSRQVQADMGEGVGAPCPSAAGLHNRTVTMRPGDVLIVPSYHVHRVETSPEEAAISFSSGYTGAHAVAHNK